MGYNYVLPWSRQRVSTFRKFPHSRVAKSVSRLMPSTTTLSAGHARLLLSFSDMLEVFPELQTWLASEKPGLGRGHTRHRTTQVLSRGISSLRECLYCSIYRCSFNIMAAPAFTRNWLPVPVPGSQMWAPPLFVPAPTAIPIMAAHAFTRS